MSRTRNATASPQRRPQYARVRTRGPVLARFIGQPRHVLGRQVDMPSGRLARQTVDARGGIAGQPLGLHRVGQDPRAHRERAAPSWHRYHLGSWPRSRIRRVSWSMSDILRADQPRRKAAHRPHHLADPRPRRAQQRHAILGRALPRRRPYVLRPGDVAPRSPSLADGHQRAVAVADDQAGVRRQRRVAVHRRAEVDIEQCPPGAVESDDVAGLRRVVQVIARIDDG